MLEESHVICVYSVVIISRPPENITVYRDSNVTISCGYQSASRLPVTWIINGTSFDQSAIENSPLYQLNNPVTLMRISLTIFSINDTTTVQCIVHSTPNTATNTIGVVTITGMYIHMHLCIYIYTNTVASYISYRIAGNFDRAKY